MSLTKSSSQALAHVNRCKTDWIVAPNRAASSGPVTNGVGQITRGRLTVKLCLSWDDGKGPELEHNRKALFTQIICWWLWIYDMEPGIPIDLFFCVVLNFIITM